MVTEITNLIIAVDEDNQSAGLMKTFAAQESPLVPIDFLPNQMSDPFEMGRYVNWLTNSIEKLRDQGDLRKCLKRCAALSRVLFAANVADSIASLARRTSVLLSYKIGELERISAMLEPLNDNRSVRLRALIEEQSRNLAEMLTKRGGPPDALAVKQFEDEAHTIVKRLLSCVRPGDDPTTRRAA